MTDFMRRSRHPSASLRDLTAELAAGEHVTAFVAIASDGTILTWAHTDLVHPLHFDWAAKALHHAASRFGVPTIAEAAE